MSEKIACFDQISLDAAGRFQGFSPHIAKHTLLLINNPSIPFRLLPRNEVESDFSIKQLVTYCLIINPDKGNILAYDRSKVVGEQRLAGNVSVGIGGHVNYGDIYGFGSNDNDSPSIEKYLIADGIHNACSREVNEEIIIPYDRDDFIHVGYVNDDGNDVGHVHLGVVYMLLTKEDKIIDSIDSNIMNPRFEPIIDLYRKNLDKEIALESWSEIVVNYLIGIFR